jgi:hypothetical protein
VVARGNFQTTVLRRAAVDGDGGDEEGISVLAAR